MIDVIPAIDLIDAKVVRLTRGDFNQSKTYSSDPVELALRFESIGIKRLHLVDLEGAKAGKLMNLPVLEKISAKTKLEIDFGGGIKNEADVASIFSAGAKLITLGSLAVKNPELFQKMIIDNSADKFILAADTRSGKVATHGWLQESDLDIIDFIGEWNKSGINNILCTDINQDGTLLGPSYELYQQILARFPDLYLIASGGVSSLGDLDKLKEIGVPAVVVGKAIYEGMISFEDLKRFCAN